MKSIPFEEKDIKKLKCKRLLILLFYIYMWLVVFGTFVATIVFYFIEDDRIPFYLMGSVTLGSGVVVFILRRTWLRIRKDLRIGTKEVIQGKVTNKYWHKNRYELTIGEKEYLVNSEQYEVIKEGQNVLIGFAPLSKITLDIQVMADPLTSGESTN